MRFPLKSYSCYCCPSPHRCAPRTGLRQNRPQSAKTGTNSRGNIRRPFLDISYQNATQAPALSYFSVCHRGIERKSGKRMRDIMALEAKIESKSMGCLDRKWRCGPVSDLRKSCKQELGTIRCASLLHSAVVLQCWYNLMCNTYSQDGYRDIAEARVNLVHGKISF